MAIVIVEGDGFAMELLEQRYTGVVNEYELANLIQQRCQYLVRY